MGIRVFLTSSLMEPLADWTLESYLACWRPGCFMKLFFSVSKFWLAFERLFLVATKVSLLGLDSLILPMGIFGLFVTMLVSYWMGPDCSSLKLLRLEARKEEIFGWMCLYLLGTLLRWTICYYRDSFDPDVLAILSASSCAFRLCWLGARDRSGFCSLTTVFNLRFGITTSDCCPLSSSCADLSGALSSFSILSSLIFGMCVFSPSYLISLVVGPVLKFVDTSLMFLGFWFKVGLFLEARVEASSRAVWTEYGWMPVFLN